jgi:hypothetical protein
MMCCLVCQGSKVIFSLPRNQPEETSSSNNIEAPYKSKDDFKRYSFALLVCSGEAFWGVKGEWFNFGWLWLYSLSINYQFLLTAVKTFIFTIQMHEGVLYLGIDGWQSPNRYDIIGMVVLWLVENGAGKVNLDAMPLDFVQLNKRHTGKYLAYMVQYISEKFALENWVCKFVCVPHPSCECVPSFLSLNCSSTLIRSVVLFPTMQVKKRLRFWS